MVRPGLSASAAFAAVRASSTAPSNPKAAAQYWTFPRGQLFDPKRSLARSSRWWVCSAEFPRDESTDQLADRCLPTANIKLIEDPAKSLTEKSTRIALRNGSSRAIARSTDRLRRNVAVARGGATPAQRW